MSRWLKNVNALLENLDNQVEETVEEHRFNRALAGADDDGREGSLGSGGAEGLLLLREEARGVDDILAKRGFLSDDEDDYPGAVAVAVADGEGGSVAEAGDSGDDTANAVTEPLEGGGDGADRRTPETAERKDPDAGETSTREEEEEEEDVVSEETIDFGSDSVANIEEADENDRKADLFADAVAVENNGDAPKGRGNAKEEAAPASAGNQMRVDAPKTIASPKPRAPSSANLKPPPKSSSSSSSIRQSTPKSNNAPPTTTTTTTNNNAATLKELRKLRRHVLQLNSDLESAEREMHAQRAELDRAASRMERDRSRHKAEKESSEAGRKAEAAALKGAHERAMQNLKESHEITLGEMEERVRRAEARRAQEGGERDADLAHALERERASLAAAAKLQDEQGAMNERIASLTTEAGRLEARLEHASGQVELASERERNAEEQLDKALSLHARQLGVRQKREGSLERTVADLGAALVVAKTKVEAAARAGTGAAAPGDSEEDPPDLEARLRDSADEIETLTAQLILERRRCVMLHDELQELAREQGEELSGAHAKQRQYERRISDLTTAVAELQSSPRHGSTAAGGSDAGRLDSLEDVDLDAAGGEEYAGLQHSGDDKKETDHLRKQITSLSEKIFEMQTRIDSGRAEGSTLKNRLRSAKLRAETAEKSLEAANQRLIMADAPGTSGMSSADEEMGLTGRKLARKRRQGGGALNARRGFPKSTRVESIRSALGLHPGRFPQGSWREMIASLLDAFDALSVDLGSHLRHYPVSRLAFMAYLAMLHAWAFFLLVYHAHAQGTGMDGGGHGPEALLRSYRHLEQLPKAMAAAAEANVSAAP